MGHSSTEHQPEQDCTDFLDLPLRMFGVRWQDLFAYFYEMLHLGNLLIQIRFCAPTSSHLQLGILNQKDLKKAITKTSVKLYVMDSREFKRKNRQICCWTFLNHDICYRTLRQVSFASGQH